MLNKTGAFMLNHAKQMLFIAMLDYVYEPCKGSDLYFYLMLMYCTVQIVGNEAKVSKNQGIRNVRFFGKFGKPCFLETTVLRFALLRYYRRNVLVFSSFMDSVIIS